MLGAHAREHAGVVAQPALGHGGIGWVKLDQDGVASETVSNERRGSSAAEWVDDRPAFRATGQDAGLDSDGGNVAK
jgi:hypothetical protein